MLKLLILSLIMLPLLATAEERPIECKEEVSLQEFVSDRESGCFVESFQDGALIYIMAPLSVGDKALTVGVGVGKVPAVAEDFQKNVMIGFYNQQGEDSGQGLHWPYSEPSRARNGKVTFGNPFNASVKITVLSPGQKRVLINRNGKSASFLCKENNEKQCDHPAIVNSQAPKDTSVPSSSPKPQGQSVISQ